MRFTKQVIKQRGSSKNMIPDNHAKSFLSKSYVNAVATHAGYGCQFQEIDYGIDAEISEVQCTKTGKFVSTGFHFNVQMKATHNFTKNNNEVIYSLDADAYNRMIIHEGGLIVLVLFCLPENPNDRILLTEDCLEIRNCCYWYRLDGDLTNNSSSKTIRIPRTQIFNPETCKNLMSSVRTGEWETAYESTSN